MLIKHFILLLMDLCLCLSELTIAPTGQIVINQSDLLEITCTASEDVDFFYPKHLSDWLDTSPSSITNETANEGSKFIFRRPKAVFKDTGYYGCVEARKNERKLNLLDTRHSSLKRKEPENLSVKRAMKLAAYLPLPKLSTYQCLWKWSPKY
ncbi:uncharacterized protein LOC141532390 [Cotesia typhae]|uniref:uncharacterized protein LOC141532390 n=1 Tax=Cotesia typhae TaxID=2053667 RepID=UPI003D691CE7